MHKHFTNPKDQRRGPNCGVTATAICAGVTFSTAWNTWRRIGSKGYPKHYGKYWRGTTQTHYQPKVLDALGVEYNEVAFNRCTLKRMVSTLERGKLYMITTTGHVQSVMDGMVIDQSGAEPVAEHWGARKYVVRCLEITTPFKNAGAQKDPKPATITPQTNTTLFPALFANEPQIFAHTQLALF